MSNDLQVQGGMAGGLVGNWRQREGGDQPESKAL